MKGYVACCLAAVPDMLKANLKKPLHLAFSYDEEVGCWGVRRMIPKIIEGVAMPIACFVGEPTEMDVVIGHKGKRSFKVIVRGRTCHSSLAPLGVNAVEYAARVIAKIRDISDRLAKSGARDALYDVPFTTGHTGYLHGGTALNIVPDIATFEFEFRVIVGRQVRRAGEGSDRLRQERARAGDEGGRARGGLRVSGSRRVRRASTRAENAEVTLLAKQLSGRNNHSKVAYGTEGGLFSQAGIPTVVMRPGLDRSGAQGRRVHRDQRAGEMRQVHRPPDRALRALSVIPGDIMAYDLILKGGRVIDPSQNIDRVTDVAFSGGKVAKVGNDLTGAAEDARREGLHRHARPDRPAHACVLGRHLARHRCGGFLPHLRRHHGDRHRQRRARATSRASAST